MEYFGELITMIFDFLKRDIVIFDHTLSLWGIILLSLIAGIIGSFIWSFLFE